MKYLSFPLLTVIAFGCGPAHRVEINRDIQPSALVGEKLPYSVAVVFSEEMKTYVEHLTVGPEEYDFEIASSIWYWGQTLK